MAALINVPVADRPGAPVTALRVGQGDAAQEFREIADAARIKHQAPMIGHQAASQNSHRHKTQPFFQDVRKS